jgi:hypothetical protein
METIHLKSVDPASQELLCLASGRGIKLSWERGERQQPQDGFARLGLSCLSCTQGPCRIDPFHHGAERGICGLDGDGMTAAFLLRLVLHGIMETVGKKNIVPAEIAWPTPLAGMAFSSLEKLGGGPLSLSEVFATALLMKRSAASPEQLLTKTLRMGLMAVALRGQAVSLPGAARNLPLKAGYGLLSGDKINIGVAGNPPRELVLTLVRKIEADASSPLQMLSLGDWMPLNDAYLPFACTSGEAELAISSGNINLLLAGPEADPSLMELCRYLNLPFIVAGEVYPDAEEIIRLAGAHNRSAAPFFNPDPSFVGEGRVSAPSRAGEGLLKDAKVAIIGGADDLLQPMGYLPTELAFALRGGEFTVAGWGDVALWMVKNGFASAAQENPAIILDNDGGLVTFLSATAAAGRLENIRGICITGMRSCADLAFALGLCALGLNICVATPVPVWGSEKTRRLLNEIMAGLGGGLTHFDHPASAQEIMQWFTGK